jgi:hypothetical protein
MRHGGKILVINSPLRRKKIISMGGDIMNAKQMIYVGSVIGVIGAGVAYFFWVTDAEVRQHVKIQLPEPEVLPTSKIPLPNSGAMQAFIESNIGKTGFPVKVLNVELVPSLDQDSAQKIDTILSEIAYPDVHGRAFRSIVSLSRRCNPGERCGTQVLAPSQLGWDNADVLEMRNRVRRVLENEIKPTKDDLIYRVTWTTKNGEQFTTYILGSKDAKPRFESMLYYSAIEKRCRESASKGPQETALAWDGEVVNGFGVSVITWKGNVTYRFQDGRLLTPDLCPNKACLSWTSRWPLWEVDNDDTNVTTATVLNAQPEEKTLFYRVIWSTWSPKKISKDGLDLGQQKGNAVSGSFSIRGDGTWNKQF